MNSSRPQFAASLMACCLGLTLAWPCAHAQAGTQTNAQTNAPAASTPPRNVYLTSGQVRTSQPTEGDLMAAGGRVNVDHAVKGDASLAGGSVEVHAAVGDDLRVAAGSVTLDSPVGGELVLSAGSITLTPLATVAQDTRLYGGTVTMGGKLAGSLTVSAQKIYLNGEVQGDVRLVAELIELGPQAKLGATLSYASPTELLKAPGAVVMGTVTREDRSTGHYGKNGERPERDHDVAMRMNVSGPGRLGGVFGFFALCALGAVALLIFPAFLPRAASTVKTAPGLSVAVGLGVLLAVPVFAVLLCVTLLGIPLGFAVMALYPALIMLGLLVGVLALGFMLRTALRQAEAQTFGHRLMWFALAWVVLMLLAWLPFIGALLGAIVMLAGLGGGAVEWYRRRGPMSPAPASLLAA
jgi:cytoskeletal protein CcmA (bactofilin family)